MFEIEQISDKQWKFRGRMDAKQAEKAATELSGLRETATIDMKELDYISSMGLSVLMRVHKQLHDNGQQLRLSHVNKHVRDVLRFTRLDQIFVILDSD